MSKETAEIKLTPKQRRFVEAYLHEAHFNGTAAAEIAGYKGDRKTLANIAWENVRKPEIRKAIDEGLESLTMSSSEVLARLTDIATGKITDVVDDDGKFSLSVAKKNRKDGLIKKLKRKTTSKIVTSADSLFDDEEKENLETSIILEEVEFEMYSAHEALRDLGRYHKLFTDKTESVVKQEAQVVIKLPDNGRESTK
jgi:hypothetical protein